MTREIVSPPFVECPDNFRCGQTVILMILKHFFPEKEWTWNDADHICAYKEGYHTWDSAVISPMSELGFEIKHFCGFDSDEFIRRPEEYLNEYYDAATVEYILANGGIGDAVLIEKNLKNINHYTHIKRDWEWSDIDQLLEQKYLIFTWVNARKLHFRHDGETAVAGHFVLLFGYNKETQAVMFHDGGNFITTPNEGSFYMNTLKNARFGINHFMNAAQSDKGNAGSCIIAFRPWKAD